MKKHNFFLLLFILTIILGCKTQIKSDLKFAYTVDKDGVYLYSLINNKSKVIYKTDRVILSEYFKQINDSTIQVGHQSKLRSEEKERIVNSKYFYNANGDSSFITDTPPYTLIDKYDYLTDSIYHIDIKTTKSFLAKVIDYEHNEYTILKIKTRNFNQVGKLISQKDTSYICKSTSTSSKGVRFCNLVRNYAESETVLGKTIIAERGDLILKEGNIKSVILKFEGYFEPKFGNGYFNPTLTSDGKKTSFQYFSGMFKKGSCIIEMEINTKIKRKLVGEGYSNPKYSPNNKLLLLLANNRQSKGNTWINDIYIFDIASKTNTKIAQGECYLWLNNLNKKIDSE